jgi:hypothetical protein
MLSQAMRARSWKGHARTPVIALMSRAEPARNDRRERGERAPPAPSEGTESYGTPPKSACAALPKLVNAALLAGSRGVGSCPMSHATSMWPLTQCRTPHGHNDPTPTQAQGPPRGIHPRDPCRPSQSTGHLVCSPYCMVEELGSPDSSRFGDDCGNAPGGQDSSCRSWNCHLRIPFRVREPQGRDSRYWLPFLLSATI